VRALINIDVPDLAAGIAFYTAAFDLRIGRRFGRAAVELVGAEAPIYLLVKPAGTAPHARATAGRDYTRHWTPVHLDIAVDDVDAAVVRVEAAGARREGPVETHAWGRIALLADPFGHGLCLLQFVGRGYDEIADQAGGGPAGG
jgi:predicted enzyme related to lactoylglutathione lyase